MEASTNLLSFQVGVVGVEVEDHLKEAEVVGVEVLHQQVSQW